jgi:hypothetical protein
MIRRRLAAALAILLFARPALADCLYDSTFPYVSAVSLFGATDLSSLGANACITSTGGSAGAFTSPGNAIIAGAEYQALGAWTPAAGQQLSIWFLRSIDGTNYETVKGTCSATQGPVQRAPDLVIPFVNAALANGDRVESLGNPSAILWAGSYKVSAWNNGTTAMSANNHTVKLAVAATKCQ